MSLLNYCNTDRQRQIVELHEQGLGYTKIGEKVGCSRYAVRDSVQAVKARAATQGWSPQHDMIHTVPDGFKVKGVSTYYNDEGQPVGQWVKSQSDEKRQIEIMLERLDAAMGTIPRFTPTPMPHQTDENLLSLLTITDFHLGMYAWEAETGDAWDVDIARQVFLDSVHKMIQGSPKSEVGVLCQLGDFLHWDGMLAITPTSSHILDADTRYGKLVELAMTVMSQAVGMMLEHFGKVVVVSAEGNHDISGSIWLRKYIKHVFGDDERVEVIDNEFPFYGYLWGETMLGFHHGHKVKLANLHKLFASEPRFRKMWGSATQTYIHVGHYHHEKVIEDGGAIAEQHPTLSGRDAYASRGGWVSRRGAKVITYHKTDGEVARITVRP
jgi:hypothetical protein